MKYLMPMVLAASVLALAGCGSRQREDDLLRRILLLEERAAAAEKTIEKLSSQVGKSLPENQVKTQQVAVASSLRAREFVLVDQNGKRRAWLGVDHFGPNLSLYDTNGNTQAHLFAHDSPLRGAGLSLSSHTNGQGRAEFGASELGGAMLDMYGGEYGGSILCLRGADGKLQGVLSASKNGASLDLIDENGKARAGLGVGKAGPSMALSDADGKTRAVMGKTATETTEGKTISYPESSLLLYGPDGKVLWQAPP